MKRLLPLLLLLLAALPARPAAPTFGQVMWTNDGSKVLLSPERSTNRVQLSSNFVTFGGVSSAFPSLWREGTTLNALLADNSGFAPFTGGLLKSRTAGMILDTEDSATPFAYSFLFRKKGDTGNTNSTLANGAELGNLQWQGWNGSAFVTTAGFLPKTEQAWVAGVSLGSSMQLRLTPSNSVTFGVPFVFSMVNNTNAFLSFHPALGGASPGLRRFGRILQVRSSDDAGFADLSVSNIAEIRGLSYTWPSAHAAGVLNDDGAGVLSWAAPGGAISLSRVTTNQFTTNISATPVLGDLWLQGTNWSVAAGVTNGARVAFEYIPFYRSLRVGQLSTGTGSEYWNTTNLGLHSVAFGSNNLAGAQGSSVLGGANNTIATNDIYSTIAGGEINAIGQAIGGHNIISGGHSNIISATTSNSVIAGGYGGFVGLAIKGATIGGGQSNRVDNGGGTVAGGFGNYAGGLASTSAGGQQNIAGNTSGSDWVFIGGGRNNVCNPDYTTIVGGETNFLQNNALYGFIGGGHGNDANSDIANIPGGSKNIINVTSPASFILGGTSNNVGTANAATGVIGNFGSNSTAKSVLISPTGTHGSNQLHVTATATTNIGPLKVQMGNATTAWAGVGGVLWSTNFPIVNAGVAETNLVSVTIPAHCLSNLNSSLIIEASGAMAQSVVGTNQIRLLYGSTVLMDTGLQTASNGWYRIRATIGSSALTAGFTNQFTTADLFWWGTGVTGMPWRDTNFNIWATQTNGINTTLSLATTSRRNGGITNESFRVRWVPNSP